MIPVNSTDGDIVHGAAVVHAFLSRKLFFCLSYQRQSSERSATVVKCRYVFPFRCDCYNDASNVLKNSLRISCNYFVSAVNINSSLVNYTIIFITFSDQQRAITSAV